MKKLSSEVVSSDEVVRLLRMAIDEGRELLADHWTKLKTDTVEGGGLVIVNGIDRPCLRLVAMVTEKGKLAKYIEESLNRVVSLYDDNENPVGKFGVDLFLSPCGSLMIGIVERLTEVRYSDGGPRKWQDYDVQIIRVAPWVAPALRGDA